LDDSLKSSAEKEKLCVRKEHTNAYDLYKQLGESFSVITDIPLTDNSFDISSISRNGSNLQRNLQNNNIQNNIFYNNMQNNMIKHKSKASKEILKNLMKDLKQNSKSDNNSKSDKYSNSDKIDDRHSNKYNKESSDNKYSIHINEDTIENIFSMENINLDREGKLLQIKKLKEIKEKVNASTGKSKHEIPFHNKRQRTKSLPIEPENIINTFTSIGVSLKKEQINNIKGDNNELKSNQKNYYENVILELSNKLTKSKENFIYNSYLILYY